jgi:hypothetical protein
LLQGENCRFIRARTENLLLDYSARLAKSEPRQGSDNDGSRLNQEILNLIVRPLEMGRKVPPKGHRQDDFDKDRYEASDDEVNVPPILL